MDKTNHVTARLKLLELTKAKRNNDDSHVSIQRPLKKEMIERYSQPEQLVILDDGKKNAKLKIFSMSNRSKEGLSIYKIERPWGSRKHAADEKELSNTKELVHNS